MYGDAHGRGVLARLKEWGSAETAVTAIEYALIAALIAVVIISAVTFVGTELRAAYEYVAHCVVNLSCE